jgi:CelD/BcsL family acetyltransferase involved in cellulose biosynthesis
VLPESGTPRAVIVARFTSRASSFPLGYVRVPTPRLRCLDIVYGGLLTDGSAEAADLITAHLRALLDSREVEHILINHLPAASPLAAPLTALGAQPAPAEPHWVVALVPGSYEKTMAHHSSKHRSKLRRYDRLLCEAFDNDVRLEAFTEPADVPRFLECATSVAEKTYQDELGVAVKDSPRWRKVLKVEAEAGRMRSYVLLAKGKPIAYQNGALYGARYLCDGRGYLPEFRDLRPGNILSLRIMADLCERGVEWIDYGFGDAEYKQVYATENWQEQTLRFYGTGLKPRLARAVERAATRGNAAARRLAGVFGLVSGLKNRWRRTMAAPAPAPEKGESE